MPKMRSAPLLFARLRWFFIEPFALWLCIGALLVAALFVWLCPWDDPESRSRWTGTVLQLFGFVTTAIGIQQTRKQFGRPGIFENAVKWYARRPKRATIVPISGIGIAASGGSAALGVGHVSAPPDASVEQRLQRLENLLLLIEQQANAIDQRLREEISNRTQKDTEERAARETSDANLRDRLELTATGGLRLSVVGLTWLVFGTILAGFAPDIAGAGAPRRGYTLWLNWSTILRCAYFAIAIGFSLFYGLKAIDIFTDVDAKSLTGPRLFHQRWLNFLGSATGWVCLWFVVTKVSHHLLNGSDPAIGWPYVALAMVAFVGITGYLPFTVVTLVNSVGRVVGKIAGIFKLSD